MIYLKKSPSNIGAFQVRVDPDSDPATAYYVSITEELQPFVKGIADSLTGQYPRDIVTVPVEDVPADLLHESDIQEPRFTCEVEDCGKDYATEKNLKKHTGSTHGNLLEKLLIPAPQ